MLRQRDFAMRARAPVGRAEGAALALVTVFNLWSLMLAVRLRSALYVLSALASTVLVFLPYAAQRVLRIRISADLRLAYIALSVGGPVLGNLYKLYYLVPNWDKGLHTLSGYAFAALGYCLPDMCEPGRGDHAPALKCACAFCVSVTIAALWEFFEYGADCLFHMDMQNDTFITEISSYELGARVGEIGKITDIARVSVNGAPMAGYLDIGLIDTMNDMLVCSLGALGYCLARWALKDNVSLACVTRVRA